MMSPQLHALVDQWVADGIVSSEQAQRMRADLDRADPLDIEPRRTDGRSILIEALGYLGGAIVLVGVALLVFRVWSRISPAGRLGLAVAGIVVLVVAGALTPVRGLPAGRRLRAVLWLGATGLAAASGSLLDNAYLHWAPAGTGTLAAAFGAAAAGGLWRAGRHPLQHASTAVGTALTAMFLTGWVTGWEGFNWPAVALCAVGTLWALLAQVGIIPDRVVGRGVGCLLSLFGGMSTLGTGPGSIVAVLVVAGWIVVAMRLSDLPILAVAAVATLPVVTNVVTQFFPGAVAAAVALVVVGLGLVGAAVVIARRRANAVPAGRPASLSLRHGVRVG